MDSMAEAEELENTVNPKTALDSTDNDAAQSAHISLYKIHGLVDRQEERRIELLEIQKQKRKGSFDLRRKLEDLHDSDSENDSETEKLNDTEEMSCEEIEEGKKKRKKKYLIDYKKCLMLSEWLVEIPSDFEENWLLMPCPVGTRCLVVASKNKTHVYNRRGYYMHSTKSALPGGGVKQDRTFKTRTLTAIDCIWNKFTETYFILDLLIWNNFSFLDCETECRFSLLKMKFLEQPELCETNSHESSCRFIPLSYYTCDSDSLTSVINNFPIFPNNIPQLDGLLFYHKETSYIAGSTPLVGWLKANMLPEVLGIPVPDVYSSEELMECETIHKKGRKHKNSGKRSSKVDSSITSNNEPSIEEIESELMEA